MDDDFNMPEALASMFELADFSGSLDICQKNKAFVYARDKAKIIFGIFGLSVEEPLKVTEEMKAMAVKRSQARKNKDFKEADRIRDEFKSKFATIVSDTASGLGFTEVEK